MKDRRIRFGGPRQTKRSASSYEAAVQVLSLSLDGRGVARPEGKTLFVRDALPTEEVEVKVEKSGKRFDEAATTKVLKASADRIEPLCQYYGQCGGCDLQHLDPHRALDLKQQELLVQLEKRAKVQPVSVDTPLGSSTKMGYRRSARVGINQRESGELLIGFRRRGSSKLVDIDHCPVLTDRLNQLLTGLRQTLSQFDRIKHLTHIEMIEGHEGVVAELRATKNISDELRNALHSLATEHNTDLQLSIKEGQTISLREDPSVKTLMVNNTIAIAFDANDFVQVNAAVNERMIDRVIQWLDPLPEDRLLDLFSGLGNFSLPLAKQVKQVTAVEGSKTMVERCLSNAQNNSITNLEAYSADLSNPDPKAQWLINPYDLILLDPPRQGAAEILDHLRHQRPRALAYIACDPSSLVRDAQTLVDQGYQLEKLCIADMFPQTHHIESLALFVRR